MKESVITLFPPERPVRASLQLAGSKSYMNRALILAALSDTPTRIENPSRSEDSLTLLRFLKLFGVESFWREGGALEVVRSSEKTLTGQVLDVGPAGTVMRFLTAYAAIQEGSVLTLRGTERMHERPIGPLVDALRALGAEIEYLGSTGCPPLRIRGKRLLGGKVFIDGNISSQFLTALLLVGAKFEQGLELVPRGELISRSYLEMTGQALRAFGVSVESAGHGGFLVRPGVVRGTTYLVEGDASGASYLWGVAALMGGEIELKPLPSNSLQGDARFPELLAEMGCEVVRTASGASLTVRGPAGRLKAINCDMSLMPDTAQTMAVIAALADGSSRITGLQTLKIKETDRLVALQHELRRVGVGSDITEDSITVHGVHPKELRKAVVHTYEDHRMAMSFALLSIFLPGLTLENPTVVAKSFPDFWERLFHLGFSYS